MLDEDEDEDDDDPPGDDFDSEEDDDALFDQQWKIQTGYREAIKRLTLLNQEAPRELLHYTNIDAFYEIVRSRSIRACRAEQSNDSAEMTLAAVVIDEALKDRAAVGSLPAAVVAEAKSLFGHEQIMTMVTCFTEPRDVKGLRSSVLPADILSMWRAYANAGQGVALHFDGREIAELVSNSQGAISGGRMLKVIYDPSVQLDLLKTALRLADSELFQKMPSQTPDWLAWAARALATELSAFAAMFKHVGFSEENEWRAVFNVDMFGFQDIGFVKHRGVQRSCVHLVARRQKNEHDKRVAFFASEHAAFAKDIFVEGDWADEPTPLPLRAVTVGPSSDQQAVAISTSDWATHHGYALKVRSSKIPFRA